MHHTVTLSLHQKFTTEQKSVFQGPNWSSCEDTYELKAVIRIRTVLRNIEVQDGENVDLPRKPGHEFESFDLSEKNCVLTSF